MSVRSKEEQGQKFFTWSSSRPQRKGDRTDEEAQSHQEMNQAGNNTDGRLHGCVPEHCLNGDHMRKCPELAIFKFL